MTIAIIILNYRTPDLTVACLKSVADEAARFTSSTGASVRVVVVDNFSNDGSLESIATAIHANGWTDWIGLLPLLRNGGFSFGNNRGIDMARDADYFILLNSDTLVQRDVLEHCFRSMESEPQIGLIGCLLKGPDGATQNAARKFPTPLGAIIATFGLPWLLPGLFAWADIDDSDWDRLICRRDVDWISGAFMFIRGAALRKVGPLDETFFFYGEDVEFCHRLARAGFLRRYDPAVWITHIGGASARRSADLLRRKARYHVQRRCYGRWAACALWMADTLASSLRSLRPNWTRRSSARHSLPDKSN